MREPARAPVSYDGPMRRPALFLATALALVSCSSGGENPVVSGPPGKLVEFRAPVAEGSSESVRLEGVEYGSGRAVVVFAHESNSSQDAWTPFAREVSARGYRAVTFNFRGYGASGGDREPATIGTDLLAVVQSVAATGTDRIFLVGGSMGGTAAIKVGARFSVAGIVSVSAPAGGGGLDPLTDVGRLAPGTAVLLIAAERDGPYAEAARALFAKAREPKQLEIVEGTDAHGHLLLAGTQGGRVRSVVLQFLDSNRG